MKTISNEELERRFDAGEDLSEFMDLTKVAHPNKDRGIKRITVDCPNWLVSGLDEYAAKIGIPRQALIKVWLTERMLQEHSGGLLAM